MNQEQNVAIQTLPYTRIHGACLSCGEDIVHPLCPECLAEGFKQWIKKFPREETALRYRVDQFLQGHKFIEGKSKRCVACGQNRTHICPYCFTEFLYKITKEAGLGVRAMSEFLFIFNFDFQHTGYSQELEVYGGY
jgi:hypothetical protein